MWLFCFLGFSFPLNLLSFLSISVGNKAIYCSFLFLIGAVLNCGLYFVVGIFFQLFRYFYFIIKVWLGILYSLKGRIHLKKFQGSWLVVIILDLVLRLTFSRIILSQLFFDVFQILIISILLIQICSFIHFGDLLAWNLLSHCEIFIIYFR